jgi:hypothetical protein
MSRRAASWAVLFLGGGAGIAAAGAPESPTVTLGPPVAAKSGPVVRGQSPDDGMHYSQWVAGTVEPAGDTVPAIMPLQVPAASGVAVSASMQYTPSGDPPAGGFAPTPPASTSGFYPEPPAPAAPAKPTKTERQHKSYFGEMFEHLGGESSPEGHCFQSDHCFDEFASPVSNPFLFEDPRALTEIRPLFIWQTVPNSNSVYRGGSALFYGTQARIAFTDQWSVVLNKLGGVTVDPGNGSRLQSNSGFAELWLGPKFTFLRNTESGTVAAAGVTFQIPTGSTPVAQDTGSLSMTPYLTAAQNFGCTSYGSFNAMAEIGYTFRADAQRSDYFFTSWHLDFDVGNQHRLYPLIELNWFHYSRSGGARPYDFEGRDLFNFGSAFVSGTDALSIGTGLRYKFSECIQTGLSLEFPLTGNKNFNDFRLGIDLIFRY